MPASPPLPEPEPPPEPELLPLPPPSTGDGPIRSREIVEAPHVRACRGEGESEEADPREPRARLAHWQAPPKHDRPTPFEQFSHRAPFLPHAALERPATQAPAPVQQPVVQPEHRGHVVCAVA